MYRQDMIQNNAHTTIKVVRVSEGYKVVSTVNTGSIEMSMQSPDTWEKESDAEMWAKMWARYQSKG